MPSKKRHSQFTKRKKESIIENMASANSKLRFFQALAVFVGTIVGVGIFGLPYVAFKSGFLVILAYFFLISAVAIIIHLVFSKICLGTEKLLRFPGYVGEYLGQGWKKITFFSTSLGLIGALLAYLIVGGEFLKFSLGPLFGGQATIYTLLFFAAGAFLIFRGIKDISNIQLALLGVFFAIIIFFFVRAFSFIDISNLRGMNLKFFTLPYGVIIFSLWGSALVPEIKEMLKGKERLLKLVIIGGILIAAITYLFFIFTILGASGQNTSKEAISGLASTLGDNIVKLGFIFGIITCFTSFITLGLTFKKVLWYDFKIPKNISWAIACFLPLGLFFAGFREFIDVIGLTGALAVGFEGVLTIFLYKVFLRQKQLGRINPLLYPLAIFFVLGVVFQVYYFFFVRI